MSTPSEYDFANILFAGPCNRSCPWCIGRRLPDRLNRSNLDVFPPLGLEAFIEEVNRLRVREIVFTGTVTDPQLYGHELALLELLRRRLHGEARIALHTNGALALRKLATFNAYDRACISLPSFVPSTYTAMMGSGRVPDLRSILRGAKIPVKVSCVLDTPNVGELDAFLASCAEMGVRRVVVRKLFDEARRWSVFGDRVPVRWFKGNPVYDVLGMEVTHWDFEAASFRSLNLFADGTLGRSYFLTDTFRVPTSSPPSG